jgi:hypothetical protein
LKGHAALPELKSCSEDSDKLVRFWGVVGLVAVTQTAGPETVEDIIPTLKGALKDDSIDVRLIAAEGFFNLGRYEDALPVLIEEMDNPSEKVLTRVGNILDSQPPDANEKLKAAVEPLRRAMEQSRKAKTAFDRAYSALTGQALYYRWGVNSSGLPESPLMAVQKEAFVPKEGTLLQKPSKKKPAKKAKQ